MAQEAAKATRLNAGIAAQTGVHDPLAEFLVYLHVILPNSAVHTVTIRRQVDPSKKTRWVVCPGTFHVWRGDLIYWSSPNGAARIELDDPRIIGISTLEVPYGGTSMGSIQAEAPSGPHHYRVVLENSLAVGDDGGDPTIIVDD
jgi:hypothetical protein